MGGRVTVSSAIVGSALIRQQERQRKAGDARRAVTSLYGRTSSISHADGRRTIERAVARLDAALTLLNQTPPPHS
jgi:hypothetical protein